MILSPWDMHRDPYDWTRDGPPLPPQPPPVDFNAELDGLRERIRGFGTTPVVATSLRAAMRR
jgi:hypothetical protein